MADNPKREFELGLLNDASSATRDGGDLLMRGKFQIVVMSASQLTTVIDRH